MRRLAALLLCACGVSSSRGPTDAGPLDFNINGIPFHISDGTAVTSGGALTLYFSDQPDACLAFQNVPVGTATTLALKIAAQSDGTARATIVARKPASSPGEAVGGLSRATAGVQNASVDAANGSIAWTQNANGTISLTALDAGFAGTSDRLATYGVTLSPCAP